MWTSYLFYSDSFALFPCPLCPTPIQSHAACHLLWHHHLLTFAAGGSRVSLLFCTHAGSPCAPAALHLLLLGNTSFPARFFPQCVESRCLYSGYSIQVTCRVSVSTLLFFSITDTPSVTAMKETTHTDLTPADCLQWCSHSTAPLRFETVGVFQPKSCNVCSYSFKLQHNARMLNLSSMFLKQKTIIPMWAMLNQVLVWWSSSKLYFYCLYRLLSFVLLHLWLV